MLKRRGVSMLVAVGLLAALMAAAPASAAPALATVVVQGAGGQPSAAYDGVVEAVRQTVVAAQVAGAVTAIEVQSGDVVKSGQVLLRIDARAAEQAAGASEAQVAQAQALLEMATKDFERQRQLFQQQYISQAALERAESQFKASRAQAASMMAQASAARTQTGLHVERAPYAGIVADVPVALGDMAQPGRPLVTLYEPGALRVSAAVTQSALPKLPQAVKIELPDLPDAQRWITVDGAKVQLLPTIDAATHTAQLRIALPAGLSGVAPGRFARVWLPGPEGVAERLMVPASAVVRRAELTALYVVDAAGQPRLRQVRLGRATGGMVEVLSGVTAGERVATDPQAAAQASAGGAK